MRHHQTTQTHFNQTAERKAENFLLCLLSFFSFKNCLFNTMNSSFSRALKIYEDHHI